MFTISELYFSCHNATRCASLVNQTTKCERLLSKKGQIDVASVASVVKIGSHMCVRLRTTDKIFQILRSVSNYTRYTDYTRFVIPVSRNRHVGTCRIGGSRVA